MFSRQTPTLDNALWQGGVSAAQAHVIANALGQCRATLDHRGPVQIDYTSPEMKLILPEPAQIQFPTIQLQPPEAIPPEPTIPEFEPFVPEEIPPFNPDPLPPPNFPEYPSVGPLPPPPPFPGNGGNTGGGGCCGSLGAFAKYLADQFKNLVDYIKKAGGAYIRIDLVALTGGFNINLDVENDTEGNICTFGDDKIKGLNKEEFVEDISDELGDWLDDEAAEDSDFGDNITVVTGITLTGNNLTVATQTVKVLNGFARNSNNIPVIECQ